MTNPPPSIMGFLVLSNRIAIENTRVHTQSANTCCITEGEEEEVNCFISSRLSPLTWIHFSHRILPHFTSPSYASAHDILQGECGRMINKICFFGKIIFGVFKYLQSAKIY